MASQADIQYHYDVNNDFYELFLDKAYRAYSCGVWRTARHLEEAQEHKLERLCKYAHVRRDHRIMDVGCGWGGLMLHAVRKHGISSAHGLTLSSDQHSYISAMPHPSIAVELKAWQDYQETEQKFDSIISIGAFEHFASLEERTANQHREVYRSFFDWCRAISTTTAYVGLQTIITARAPESRAEVRDTRYLLERVFPGSALPTLSDIQAAIVDRYEMSAIKRIGFDYVRTLACWKHRLLENREAILSKYGTELFRHYERYLTSAQRSFEVGIVDLLQVSLKPVNSTRIVNAEAVCNAH